MIIISVAYPAVEHIWTFTISQNTFVAVVTPFKTMMKGHWAGNKPKSKNCGLHLHV